jgi:colanic acid biosynthesis glycosyl transferase WcaI
LLLFSGNMGVTQQLEPIIGAAISLASAPVRFCFVGGGPEQGSWRTRLSGLPNVTFLPFQPDPDYRALLCASDVGVVTLASNLEQLVSPSRALPFLSAGIPLLAVMSPETELGRLIHAYGCGACVATAEEFAHVVEDWCRNPRSRIAAGRGARRAYEQTRNADVLKRRYVELCR